MFEWNVYKKEKEIRESVVLTRDMVIAARERGCDYEETNQEVQRLFSNWNTITASLDNLGDTSAALCQFIDNYPENNIGAQYLYVYGAVQSLSMQQKAVQSILECFNIKQEMNQRLLEICQIRIDLLHADDIRRRVPDKAKRKISENTMLSRLSLKDSKKLKILYAHSKPEDKVFARKGIQTINLHQIILEHDALLSRAIEKTGILEMLNKFQKPILKAAESYDAAMGYGREVSQA